MCETLQEICGLLGGLYLGGLTSFSFGFMYSNLVLYELERFLDLLDSSPFVEVLGLPGQYIQAFKNIDDIVDASPFDA